jgi:hypothetical protein
LMEMQTLMSCLRYTFAALIANAEVLLTVLP